MIRIPKFFRRLLIRAYHGLWIYRIQEWHGKLSVAFYRLLYPNFFIGKGCRVWGKFHLLMYDPESSIIKIGSGLRMISSPARAGLGLYSLCTIRVFPNADIEIGNNVWLNGTSITCRKRIVIGEGTIFSPNVSLLDSDHHVFWPPEKRLTASTAIYDRAIHIGRNAWIGHGAAILKGVSIGDNSIIGAHSVVTTDIPANVLAAGNPARVLRRIDGLLL